MSQAHAILAAILLSPVATTEAQSFDDQRAINAMRDQARAQERQADELRRLRQIEGDRARQEDRDRRNAERDARSLRRFDRP